MPAPTDKDTSPPYLSFSTVKNFMDSFRESGVPNRIDKTLVPGQSGTTQTYLMSAMRFFGFIDQAGKPTERMAKWDNMPDDEKFIFEEAIKDGYSFLFEGDFKVESATEGEIREKLSEKSIQGETARKAITFFVAACTFAGIPVSPHLKGNRAGSGSSGPKRGKRKKAPNGAPAPEAHQEPAHATHGHTKAILPLNAAGTRVIKLEAPPTVTKEELARITSWLSFQLIVAPSPKDEDDDLDLL
ncbi:MAG: DUF5343 domain-containing protein [Verrucomicrobiota bacterium]